MDVRDLLNVPDPAMPLVKDWISRAIRPVEILPPSAARGEVLLQTQITTRSPMGAVAYETGGILVEHGWLRILGSGHPRLMRTLPGWNANRSSGYFLVADDAVGGFFAINGGAWGGDVKCLYYFAPDTLKWEPMEIGFSEFLQWVFTGPYDEFCEPLRWKGWEESARRLHGDRCIMTVPPLWTAEGRGPSARRGDVPIEEAWGLQMDMARWINEPMGNGNV